MKKIFKKAWWLLATLAIIFGFVTDTFGVYSLIFGEEEVNEPIVIYEECYQDSNIRGEFFKISNLMPNRSISFFLGNNLLTYDRSRFSEENKCIPLNSFHICTFQMRIVDDEMLIDLTLFDENNKLIGLIKGNNFVLNEDCVFSYNLDRNGFEIVNQKYQVVFSMNRVARNIVSVKGIFVEGDKGLLVTDSYMTFFMPSRLNGSNPSDNTGITRMFEYAVDGEDWIGRRVNVNP